MRNRRKVLVTLRYLAKGDFYSEVGDLQGISRSSVSRSISVVVAALDRKLKTINFPTSNEELRIVKTGCFRIGKIPKVVGAVDGTLIPIIAPSEAEEVYVCRKGYHALNVQAVVDHQMRFTDVVAQWPGSVHDSTVMENCALKQWLTTTDQNWL
ncbi:putative nuclease HARBI1 isoform X5 [Dreissena polymorpha]|uniref:putative nuclease HARBI1 isoform X5 n=1 Tax=Dreissena polymorpha TaxID=45954 RepID=UPI002263B2FA|nr:putative nuclease HARBI1 isoform X5 [Dreissena polymorpha]